jgi:hypothetical protein
MATLNELGRNSASITYLPSGTGSEAYPTFALVDQWLRNDTFQGYATASSSTVTGVGSIYTTQLRAGDTIMLAGQMRTVLSVTSDTSFTVTSAFSPAITIPSALKAINTTLSGTITTSVRGATSGKVSVTAGSATITGVGTSFTTDATNSASGTAGVVGRTIQINGRYRTITAIASDTSMTVNAPMDFTDSNLNYKVMPRGTIAVTAGSSTVTGTGTNFAADLTSGDQIWIGDELVTITFSGGATTAATLSANLVQAVTGVTFYRDDSYIAGSSTAFTTELRVGDDLIIDGQEVTVTRIINDTSFRINEHYPENLSGATVYKKKKLHGWVLEGTREANGAATAGNKFGIATTMLATGGTAYPAGTNVITVASGTNFSQYGFIKIAGGGGPAQQLTGTVTASASTTLTGTNTLFTTELHVGAEICVAGQYLTVLTITSNTSCTVSQTVTVTGGNIYRTVPLYTYIAAVSGAVITLGTPLKNTIYSTGTNPAQVWTPGSATAAQAAADFIEFVYSAPNKSAEATTTLFNTSLDRKYMGFRFYPLGGTGIITTANAAYNLPVYERWVASYGQTGGVGVNLADQSGGIVAVGTQSTTTFTATAVTSGTITVGTVLSAAVGTVTALGTGTGGAGTYTVTGSQTLASQTVTGALSGVTDQTVTTLITGGFLYLFGKPRYFMIQGKSYANAQQAWLGCCEFERAQPEDTGTGLGTSAGVSYYTGAPVTGTPGVSPWPCYGYFHSNRFPVGSAQTPTLPIAQTKPVHGGIYSVPRIRASTGDLTGLNAHVYTAATITTGRWGHLWELGASGGYQSTNIPVGGILTTNPADTVPQPHVGQLVPIYTNVYNSKRFMFSPVCVLGPAYDPDIRGRIYGLKVIPSNLGTLMDTVSVTTDANDFYDNSQPAADHWVVTASVQTYRFILGGTTTSQAYRSLEDPGASASSNSVTAFTNNFRWAVPA